MAGTQTEDAETAHLLVCGRLLRRVRGRCMCDPVGNRRSGRWRPAAVSPATTPAPPPAAVSSSSTPATTTAALILSRGLPRALAGPPVTAPASVLMPRHSVGLWAATTARVRAPPSAPTATGIALRPAILSPAAAAAATATPFQVLILLLRSSSGTVSGSSSRHGPDEALNMTLRSVYLNPLRLLQLSATQRVCTSRRSSSYPGIDNCKPDYLPWRWWPAAR